MKPRQSVPYSKKNVAISNMTDEMLMLALPPQQGETMLLEHFIASTLVQSVELKKTVGYMKNKKLDARLHDMTNNLQLASTLAEKQGDDTLIYWVNDLLNDFIGLRKF